MGLYEKSKSLIISISLCSIKHMIQLSDVDVHEVANLFSRQDLRDCVFQDSTNKSQSWVNFFALSLSNSTRIVLFGRNYNLLDKMPFQHLVHYCKARTTVDTVRVLKVSTCSTSVKYKFGRQVPKGIKNVII
jgi:hypothetical protein